MINLSIRRQCELLGLNRSSYYLPPAIESEENLRLMRLIDEQFLKTPFYGSRRMTACLERSGEAVNRKRVQRLMALMGLEALFPRPRTTTRGIGRAGLPVPAPRSGADPRRRGLEFGHHLCSDEAWLHVPDGGDRLVQPVRALVAAVEHAGGRGSAWRRWTRRCRWAGRRSSTPTRVPSSRRGSIPAAWRRPGSR